MTAGILILVVFLAIIGFLWHCLFSMSQLTDDQMEYWSDPREDGEE